MIKSMSKSSKQTATGLLICAVAVLVWFSPWWISGKNLAPLDILNEMMQPWRGVREQPEVKNHIVSDGVDQYLVYRMVAAESYRKEGWLGWSSLTYGGTAQYANTMALYYDWTMQLHRWLDFWSAWHLGLMGQVMLAASGMLLFLRGRSIGILWACCGALAYAANSQFVAWIYHRWALSAFCWVPWILWAIDGYRRGNRSFWPFIPGFIALGILGGTLQHAAFVILAVGAIWAEESLKIGWVKRLQTRLLARYLIWGILGCGMAAMMLLPCTEAFLTSTKLGLHMGMHGTATMGTYPKGPLQPLLNLAAYPLQIFPSVLGRCETVDLLKLFKSELFYIAYFGSLPVLIAFLAFFRKQTPVLARVLIGMGLILPLTPLLRHLYQRLYLLFILGGILAFVHFMQTASADTKKLVFKYTGAVAGLVIAVWSMASLAIKWNADAVHTLLYQRIVAPSVGSSFGHFRDWMQVRADKFANDLLIWSPQQMVPLALFLVGLAGLRLTASNSEAKSMRGAWMLAVAIVLEVSTFGARWVTFTDPIKHPLFPMTQEAVMLQKEVGSGSVATINDDSGSHMAVTPFIPNTLSPYGIATIHGYDSIMPNGMLLINNPARDPQTLGKMGVTHLITYPANQSLDRGWIKVWESPSLSLFENPKAIPKYIGFTTLDDQNRFFQVKDTSSFVALTERHGMENTREINAPAGISAIRVSENQATGWKYQIPPSKDWLPVVRAPDASMIMEIAATPTPAPTTVRMRYDPPMRKLGFQISAAALLATLCGFVMVLRSPHPTHSDG